MKTITKFTILLLLTILINLNNAHATSIAVIDIENVLKNSMVMKNIQNQIDNKRQEFQKDINKKQTTLSIKSRKLSSKQTTLSKEAFKKKQIEFEKEIKKITSYIEKKQNSLKSASFAAIEIVNEKINNIIDEISKENNLDLIIPSSQTLFYKNEIDISSQLLKRLNKAITKVNIKFD